MTKNGWILFLATLTLAGLAMYAASDWGEATFGHWGFTAACLAVGTVVGAIFNIVGRKL